MKQPSHKLVIAVHQFLNVIESEMMDKDKKEDLYFDLIEIVKKYLGNNGSNIKHSPSSIPQP